MRSLQQCTNRHTEPLDPAVPDLERMDQQTRRFLYERIAAIVFDGISGAGEPAMPPADPRRFGLAIFWLCGRWFATWSQPEKEVEPSRFPRALIHIEADPKAPLGLVLHVL